MLFCFKLFQSPSCKGERINRRGKEERDKKRECDCLRKEKSHKNQSREKIQGIKVKDKNRKRKQCHPELYNNNQTPVDINSSTERVRKHRQKKEVDYQFTFYTKEH